MDVERARLIERHGRRWMNMIGRCYDPEHKQFRNYGGRGISVCAEWHSFEGFLLGLPDGWFGRAEMDRIDNDGNYEPSNVRWATKKQNCANRRTARLITANGETRSLTEWAESTGIDCRTISDRIDTQGWSAEKAVSTPVLSDPAARMAHAKSFRKPPKMVGHREWRKNRPKRQDRTFSHDGRQMTLRQLSAECGVPLKLLRKRICERGWTVDRAICP